MNQTANKSKKTRRGNKRILKEIGFFLVDILYNAIIIIILVILIRTFLISPFRVIGSSMADTLHSNEFILIDKLSYRIGEPERGDPIVFRPPITSKYPPKFEEAVTTDENGIGKLDLGELVTNKNVIYCQNDFVKKFWFCKDEVHINDLVYFRSVKGVGLNPGLSSTWKNAKKKSVSQEEIDNEMLTINGEPNQSYSIRIYDISGPEFFVKRIIGIPGDGIKIENGRVYLKAPQDEDFVEIEEVYLNEENAFKTYFNQKTNNNTFTVPEGHYFVLGDNRNHSNDSRSWFSPIDQEHTPYVSKDYISGKVLVVLWPVSDIRFISGADL